MAQPTIDPTSLSEGDTSLLQPDEELKNQQRAEALTETMKLAKTRFNKGITQPRNKTMMEILGPPRDSYSTDCQSVTNAGLKAKMETRQIGPLKVTML